MRSSPRPMPCPRTSSRKPPRQCRTDGMATGGWIGARLPRLEDGPLLVGKGRFIDDITLPGVLHAAFVRSPHPHAAIRGVDARAALALPGVHAVLTLDDLPP